MTVNSSRLKIGGLLAVLVMALTAALFPLSLSWVDRAREERDQVEQRLAILRDVLELLVDAETGQRGYVITGKEEFLQPYHAALTALPTKFMVLEQRYAGERPPEKKLVAELLDSARTRLAALTHIVQRRQMEGFVAAQPLVMSGHGRAEMDRVRLSAARLGLSERQQLGELDEALRTKIRWSISTSLLSTLLTLVLLGYLGRMMFRAIKTGQQSAAEAHRTSEELEAGMGALKCRNQEISALGEMSRLLQTEMNLVEALEVTSLYTARLLPTTSGSVYLFRNSADLLEMAASWGKAEAGPLTLEPSACWALRRGQTHRHRTPSDLRCRHCEALSDHAESTCLPLMAYGEVLGLLHVISGSEAERPGDDHPAELAQAISEQVALALSNAKLRQVLRDQSIRDPLTGLYNRRYMEETLNRELARAQRNEKSLSIVVADLDHFKKINDTHGHPAGDAVLRAATRQIAAMVRASDVVCRYGGEEFVLILPDCVKEAAVLKAQQICDALRRLVIREGSQAIAITASFGVASSHDDGADPVALFQAADAAVYEAKRAGRDRVVCAGLPG